MCHTQSCLTCAGSPSFDVTRIEEGINAPAPIAELLNPGNLPKSVSQNSVCKGKQVIRISNVCKPGR